MREDLKQLDRLLSGMTTRATTKRDINQLKTILIKHLNTLGENYPNHGALHLEGFDQKLEGFNIELEDGFEVELKPLEVGLLDLDPCPKTEKRSKKNDN